MSPALQGLCFITLGLYLSFAVLLITQARGGLDPAGTPVGYDFSAYYEAAQFARAGKAAAAYDDARMIVAEQDRFAGSKAKLPWNYPPSFQLLLLPFSYLPYMAAFTAWAAGLLGAYVLFLRRLISAPPFLPLLLFPGAVINLFLGTNGLLEALFIGAGLLLMERRPVLAGLFLGLASVKPHLALIIPLALLFGRHYRALAAMLATVAALAAASMLVFGVEPWLAFFAKAANAAGIAQSGSSDWRRVPTLYTLMLTLGLTRPIAILIHGAAALSAIVALGTVWRRDTDMILRGATLALAILIVTPYARVYDFALLIFPLAWLRGQVRLKATAPLRLALSAAWTAPLIGLLVGAITPALSLLSIALMAMTLTAKRDDLSLYQGNAVPQTP